MGRVFELVKAPLAGLSSTAQAITNVLRGQPVLVTFQICLRCNSACAYCDLPLNQGRYEMSRGEIQRVFSNLYDEGIRFVLVQGGEPLLRQDLAEILEDLSAIGLRLTLITNGTRLTEALIRRLSRLPLAISISLDTLDRTRYRQIRGADQLPQVLSGIALLTQYPHPKFLTCIVSEVNRHEVEQVVRFANDHGFVPVVGAYHWNVGSYGKKDAALMYERHAASLVFEKLLDVEVIPRGYFRLFAEDNVKWLRGEGLEPCDAGRYSIAIDASGNVAPCLALPAVGNLLDTSLGDILARFDRSHIRSCSDRSSCNRLDGRIVGSMLRHPITAWRTPVSFR